MKDKQQSIFLLVTMLLFAGVLVYGMIRYRGEDFGLYEKQIYDLNADWRLEDGGPEVSFSLPAELNIPCNTKYSVSTRLPEDFSEGMSILYRTTQQSVRIMAGNDILYERGQDASLYPGDFRGSSWNIVLIPQKYAGQKLTMTLVSPYTEFSGKVNEVQYGDSSGLMYYIIQKQAGQLFCAALMLIIGIGLCLFHIIKARTGTRSVHIAYLALFSILCALYLLGESRMLQFYTSNEFLVTALPFLCEILFPIPLLMYIRDKWMPQHRWVAVMFQWVFIIDFVIVILLQLTGIADFFETMIVFHVSVISLMVAIIIVSGIEVVKYRYKEGYVLAQALGILILGSAAGIWQVCHEATSNVGISIQIGMIGFELVMAIDSIQGFYQHEEELREKQYYEKLAYIDALTDGQNRNAYMDRIFKEAKKEKRKGSTFYALYDMNNLKAINDTYGHATGDDAIQRTYRCLIKAFGRYGDCYRIGGDEFAVIMDGCNEEDFEAAKKALEHEIDLNNREVDYLFSIAGGYAACEPDAELSFEALMKQADQMLYRNKHRMKLK